MADGHLFRTLNLCLSAAIDTKRCRIGTEQSILPFTIQERTISLSKPLRYPKNDDVALYISHNSTALTITAFRLSPFVDLLGSEHS